MTMVNNIVLHIWKLLRVNLNSSLKKKRFSVTVMEDNKTYYGDCFAVYTNIKTSCYIFEINMLYVKSWTLSRVQLYANPWTV